MLLTHFIFQTSVTCRIVHWFSNLCTTSGLTQNHIGNIIACFMYVFIFHTLGVNQNLGTKKFSLFADKRKMLSTIGSTPFHSDT